MTVTPKMGIVIPWDFSRDKRRRSCSGSGARRWHRRQHGECAHRLCPGSRAGIFSGDSNQVASQHGQSIQPAPVSVENATWYNEDLESSAFIVPGVLALVMS